MSYGIQHDPNEVKSFDTGSVRSDDSNKPRYDLIPVNALHRLAMLYSKGAKVYGEGNWTKGQPRVRLLASAMRHLFAYIQSRGKDTSDDHLAAVIFNVMAIMYFDDNGWKEGQDTWSN